MKKQIISIMVCLASLMTSSAYAEGCLKGAAIGGVAGHFAGRHTVIGAVGGCLVGRHMAKKDKEAKAQAQAQAQQRQQQQLPQAQQPQIINNSNYNK